jgi:ribosomal protein S6E (S10)
MEETELQSRLRNRLGLRVGPEMAKYLLKKLSDGTLGQGSISAMGGDAKTGIPMHQSIPIATLKALAEDQPTPQA